MRPIAAIRPKGNFILCAAVWLGISLSAQAATLVVINTHDRLAGSLRQAIQDAAPGDTITFNIPTSDAGYNASTGVFTISLTSGELKIANDVSIDATNTKIVVTRSAASGTPKFRIFSIASGRVALSGLSITGGLPEDQSAPYYLGGGIYNSGTLTLRDCAVYANGGHDGGGLYNGPGGEATLVNCSFWKNLNGLGCAIYNAEGASLSVQSCTISRNGADAAGNLGGIYNAGTAHVGNSIIADNDGSPKDVGGTFISDGYNFIGDGRFAYGFGASGSHDQVGSFPSLADPQLGPPGDHGGPTFTFTPGTNSPVVDQGRANGLALDQRGRARPVDQPGIVNAAGGDGADIGAYEIGGPTTFVVTNTDDGGAGSLRQAIADANSELQSDSIVFNIPTSDPGYHAPSKVYSINLTSGELAITNPVTIDGGKARITIERNGAAASFRLFDVSASPVTISNLFLRNGAALGFGAGVPGAGGAVFNSGILTLLNCTFFKNTATGGAAPPQLYQGLPGGEGLGGAVCNDGTLVMTNCTLSDNSVQGGAGGTGLSGSGINARGGNGGNARGGALFSDQGAVTVTNCTFTENSAQGGAGGSGDAGYGSAGNGIGGGALFASGSATLYNNILSGNTAASDPDSSGTIGGYANFIGGMPKLDRGLQYDGGPTPIIALLPDSPAINGGLDQYAPATDQRGYPRVGISDLGAFEFGSSPPAPTTLANISTRLPVGTGDNALIGGFIVTGTQPKKVIVRGIGPSLPFAGHLENPTIELRDSSGALVDANDDWGNSPNKQAIIDSTIPPSNDLESAIVATLPANNAGYTAVLRGLHDGSGIGVIEAYDLDNSVDSKLANISTRGLVQTGDDVLIAGTIVVGPAAQKVIVRAIGPSFGFAGALDDPTLELRDQNGALLEANDNWVESPNKQAIIDSTIPPSNDVESAIVATLPGNGASYTAIVRGVNGTTGIGSVEVYALQ